MSSVQPKARDAVPGLLSGLPCTIMRGGTSRAVFFWSTDLPSDACARDRVILDAFGSPDFRQIDGLGGADPLTSKVAIIDRGAPDGNHLSYTFGQVEITDAHVDYKSLCGNITSAVGVFGVLHGLCDIEGDTAEVRVWNTNFSCQLRVAVRLRDGQPEPDGDFVVAGVPGTGSPIVIDFADTAGRSCGKLLPTGNVRDSLACDFGEVAVTMIDVGNPHVFVTASSIGLTGFESSDELTTMKGLLARLETLREAAARRMGLLEEGEVASRATPAVPILAIVARPMDYRAESTDIQVEAETYDVRGRVIFMQRPHKAYAGTSTVATGVAARIPGTVIAECAGAMGEGEVVIGHPQGLIRTTSEVSGSSEDEIIVSRATVTRTARLILEGRVYLKTPMIAVESS